jgi:hypothetical protein
MMFPVESTQFGPFQCRRSRRDSAEGSRGRVVRQRLSPFTFPACAPGQVDV